MRNLPSVVKTLRQDGDMSTREIRSLTFKVTLLAPGEDIGARAAITLEKKSDIMNNNPPVGIINLLPNGISLSRFLEKSVITVATCARVSDAKHARP